MIIPTDFLVAGTVALVVSLMLIPLLPRVATALVAQIILTGVGVWCGLAVKTALSCAVIIVWLVIVAVLCVKWSRINIQITKTYYRRFDRDLK